MSETEQQDSRGLGKLSPEAQKDNSAWKDTPAQGTNRPVPDGGDFDIKLFNFLNSLSRDQRDAFWALMPNGIKMSDFLKAREFAESPVNETGSREA